MARTFGFAEMTYRVVIERDDTGAWLARVPDIPGCHTYGRSLAQTRRRIREALGLWMEDSGKAVLEYEIRLPAEARREIRRVRAARERSTQAQRVAQGAAVKAARDLTKSLGLSVRDAAELLQISHQRVQQLVSAK